MTRRRSSFHIPESTAHYRRDREFQTEHIKLTITVDLEARRIAGKCAIRLRPLRSSLSSIHFDACEMQIESVSLDGARAEFEHDGSKLTVYLSEPLTTSSSSAYLVEIDYSATPRQGMYFVHPDEERPHKPVQAWTHSEAEHARYWVPCFDHPEDRSSSETIVTVAEPFLAVSNGKLVAVERKREDGKKTMMITYHWSESFPHSTYLKSIVVGKFAEVKAEADGIPISYYVPETKRNDALRYFGLTPDMLKTYNRLIGVKYPYEKYAQVAVHDFIYGGMEHISATTMTDTRFPDERSEEDYASSYSKPERTHINLVSHELAHQWFGDLVTTKGWAHAWLNEGFAEYFQALYLEKHFGVDEFRQNMEYKAEAYFKEDESKYRRAIVDNVYVYPDDLFDTHLYEKAAWMLHQLRYMLGDETFFRGVREYLTRLSGKNAETDDFRKVLEEVSGRSLERHFEQSFYRGGYPEFEIEYSWDQDSSTASLLIRQVQQVDELTPIFSLPCEVVFYTEKLREVRRMVVSQKEERFSFWLWSKPSFVEFDPEEWLLKKVKFQKSAGMLLAQLESGATATSRKRAAKDLESFRSDGTVDALRTALEKEQHWSVRAEAARSIGKIGSEKALQALLSLTSEPHRRVRRAVIEALANFKDQDKATSKLKEILLSDISPYVQSEAAISLGKSGAKDVLSTLVEAMKIPSPESVLTEACLEAMGHLRGEENAKEILREHLSYRSPTRARLGALKAFTHRGFLYEDEVSELKTLLGKDAEYSVRAQVIETVEELADKRFLESLSKAAQEDVDPRIRRRALDVYYALTGWAEGVASIVKLKEEVERLKAENQELRQKLSAEKVNQ